MLSLIRSPWLLAFGLALAGFACGQYEFASPGPGILEVRLAVRNTVNAGYIPFGSVDSTGQQSRFFINLNELIALQAGTVRLPIFASLNAIRRNPDGDPFNSLDVAARDSLPLLGAVYAPPGAYAGFEFNASIFPIPIFVNNPPVGNQIPVTRQPPFIDQLVLSTLGQVPLEMPVLEGRTTRVVITFDLDRSLTRRAESFDYTPVFYVSSFQVL